MARGGGRQQPGPRAWRKRARLRQLAEVELLGQRPQQAQPLVVVRLAGGQLLEHPQHRRQQAARRHLARAPGQVRLQKALQRRHVAGALPEGGRQQRRQQGQVGRRQRAAGGARL
jgi:hypothetical protein